MTISENTAHKIERALKKAASKFNAEAENYPLTDLHLQVKQHSGELLIFDDDDTELTRCVIDEWIGNTSETFYDDLQPALTLLLTQLRDITDHFALLRPYSFVLIGDDHETIADLYLVDDDTIVVSGELMEGLSDELDKFWEEIAKE